MQRIILISVISIVSIATWGQQSKPASLLPENFGNTALSHVKHLCETGVRSAGTLQERMSATYLLEQFQKANIESAIEPFEFVSFEIEKTDFRVGKKAYTPSLIGFNPYNGIRSYNGPAILYDNDHFLSGIHPSEIAGKAIISNNPENYFRLMVLSPNLIVYVDSLSFKEIETSGDYDFTLGINGQNKKHQSFNVVSSIGSKSGDAKEIIISAHYDSYKTSPGADDNGSGTGVLIELARYFNTLAIPAGIRIKFVAFGAEELAVVGSRVYLDAHSKSLEHCELLINLDQIGGSGDISIEMLGGVTGIPEKKGTNQFPEFISGRSGEGMDSKWRLLEPLVMKPLMASNHPQWLVDEIEAAGKELDIKIIPAGNLGSDQMVFAQAGIPSTGIAVFGNDVHNPHDTPEKVHPGSLQKAGEIAARAVLKTVARLTSVYPEDDLKKSEVSAHLRFLASDELKGRKTGSSEAVIAARYIAEQFRSAGLRSFFKSGDFLQQVTLIMKNKEVNQVSDSQVVHCNNVIGYLEGTNPALRTEYVLLIAHFDHLGVKKKNLLPGADSIFNGARDNGMGTVALITAAKALAADPPARPVIFVASTGEEEGLLGSRFLIKNTPVDLKKIVFVLNNDGGGFNDTTMIRIGGLKRITSAELVGEGSMRFGLKAMPYPDTLSYLYELSDSYPFAATGIPAITISPGFDKIDDEILKYVHTTADEANDSFNYTYLLKFCQTYIAVARIFANSDNLPFWIKKDEFYEVGKKLKSNF